MSKESRTEITEETGQKILKALGESTESHKNFCELYPNLCTKEDARNIVSEEIAKIKIPEPKPVDLTPIQEELKTLKESLPQKPEGHALKHPTSAFMTYCPSCGIKVKDKPPTHECVDCGAIVDVRDNYCWNCGGTKARKRDLGKLKLE